MSSPKQKYSEVLLSLNYLVMEILILRQDLELVISFKRMHLPLTLHLFLFMPPNISTVNMGSFEEVPTQTLREEMSLPNTFDQQYRICHIAGIFLPA